MRKLPVFALFVGMYACVLVYLVLLWSLGAAVPGTPQQEACMGADPVPTLSRLIGCVPGVLAGYVGWVVLFFVFSCILFVPQVNEPLVDARRRDYHALHDGLAAAVGCCMALKFAGLFLIAAFPSVAPDGSEPDSRGAHYLFAGAAFGFTVLESFALLLRRLIALPDMWSKAPLLLALNVAWVVGEIAVGVALATNVIGALEVALTAVAAADRVFQVYDYHADTWELRAHYERTYTNGDGKDDR